MNRAFLLIGGNLGKRKQNLVTARALISRNCGKIVRASSLYETAAWGKTDQPSFLNQALEIETFFGPKQFMQELLQIEEMMGRKRDEKYGPRIIDIDILLFNNETHDTGFLTVPHPELQNRRFALVPLAEIAPDLLHPVFNKKISALLAECRDKLDVNKI
jgi:2-amino-4-hydroxy-6-hydroxymethyldihydropteridine diphosphokinase